MKKALTLLLVLCMIFTMAACGGQEPAETKPVEIPTEPAVKEYVLLRTKADIMQGLQMTPDNMNAWLEEYTTTNEEEAKNAIRASQKKSIEYMWTKEQIPGGTLLMTSMFTTKVPDGVIPDDPTEDLTYDTNYIGVIDHAGMYVNIPASDITSKFTGTGKSIKITSIDILVKDLETSNEKQYTERLTGEYNLKSQTGTLKFAVGSEALDLGGFEMLLGNTELIVPALVYSSYTECGFTNPIVQITANLEVDGKEQTVLLGGTFTLTIDPNSGLTATALLDVLNNIKSGGGLGGGMGSWLEDLLGGGAGLGDLFGGSGGN